MKQTQISRSQIPKLRKAMVLLRCSEPTHKNCLRMRDLLVKKVNNITQAYTTNTTIDGETYCVAARALVEEDEIEQFETTLNALHTTVPRDISVEQVLVLPTA